MEIYSLSNLKQIFLRGIKAEPFRGPGYCDYEVLIIYKMYYFEWKVKSY